MSLINNIADVVSKAAPLLGAALSTPIGGVASIALSLIANLFSANPKNPEEVLSKLQADPEATFKLKQLEFDHQEFLIKSQNELIVAGYQDRSNARDLEEKYLDKSGHGNYMLPFLVVMLFASLVGCIYCIINYSTIVGETIAFMMGTFREELKDIYGMYFGDVASGDTQNVQTKR